MQGVQVPSLEGELRLRFPHAAQHGQIKKKKKIRAEINEIETTTMIKRLTILRAGLFKDRRFPSGLVVKNLPVNAGDMVSISDPVDPTCHGTAKPTCYTY